MHELKEEGSAAGEAPPEQGRAVSLPLLCVYAVCVGVVAGVGAVVFRLMISVIYNFSRYGVFSAVYDANRFSDPSPFGPWVILVPVVGGLIVVWLVENFAPEAKGHGVPEVMYAVYHRKGDVRGRVSIIKSLASALSIGTGASVGREGPIIQIGASFGSTFARLLGLARWQKVTLLAAGAGAGIAGTFNTPIGGVMFAVELLLPEISNRTFLPVVVATTSATSICRIVLGPAPAFFVPSGVMQSVAGLDLYELFMFAMLGVLAGVASWAFIRLLAFCEDNFVKLPGNAYTQNMVGMLFVGVLGYAFQFVTGQPHTIGVGYATIQAILEGQNYVLLLALALLAGKVVATSVSLGSGASGGIFSPSLFVGAALGASLSALGNLVNPGDPLSSVAFAVVGMGAVVGGATGASMTAIVMIFEMTRDYNVIVPLVLAVALAVGVRRALIRANIYTIKLRDRGTPIPVERHTNMYLVKEAQEVMSKDFIVLPSDTRAREALETATEAGVNHIIVGESDRILGVVRLGEAFRPNRSVDQQLREWALRDYVIAPTGTILNTIIARMNDRNRTIALVTAPTTGLPRQNDILGVIDSAEIARAVIVNHYG